jgi:hypothetical protein
VDTGGATIPGSTSAGGGSAPAAATPNPAPTAPTAAMASALSLNRDGTDIEVAQIVNMTQLDEEEIDEVLVLSRKMTDI